MCSCSWDAQLNNFVHLNDPLYKNQQNKLMILFERFYAWRSLQELKPSGSTAHDGGIPKQAKPDLTRPVYSSSDNRFYSG
jgi:hypothetical protein